MLSRISRRRPAAVVLTLALAAGVLVSVPAAASATPKPPAPPKVSQNQVNSAAAAKAAVAAQVGSLGSQIATAQAQLQRLQGQQQLAEQKVSLAVSLLEKAQAQATAAKAAVTTAQKSVEAAHVKFVQYLQASYMYGSADTTNGALLTAKDPSALLEQSSLESYEAQNKLTAVGNYQRATVAKSNADAKARAAVLNQTKLTERAKAAKQAADQAVANGEQQKADLQASLASKQAQLATAQTTLATLNGQRVAWLAYQERLRLARIAAAKAAAARAEAAREAAARQKAAREAADRLAAAGKKHKKKSTGGGGGGGSTYVSGPSAPSSGGWTAAKGKAAAARARYWLGETYIWAGGNQYGPTDGGCTDPIASCGTTGFDCSGLVLYAWDRGWAHFAATQYYVGSKHPSPGNFKPGDLLFWSENGAVSGIGHVAIYIGHGDVVQAPQSGDVVKITPWDQVESGYFGATRPLT